jgi:hypothetical protein
MESFTNQQRPIDEDLRAVANTDTFQLSCKRKKAEMRFAHMKRIPPNLIGFGCGLSGARDEVLLTATAQSASPSSYARRAGGRPKRQVAWRRGSW